MATARKLKQISFGMPDKPGLLAQVTSALTDAKVNINSICAYGMEGRAFFMLITDSNAKAKKTLAKLRVKVTEEDVCAVEMPNKAGALHKIAKRITDAGINIYYLYGTTGTGKSSICIFSSSDDKKALKAINKQH